MVDTHKLVHFYRSH